jgi:hypothetical protein
MAGTVTQTRSSDVRKQKGKRPSQVLVTLACVSDSSTGLVPSETLSGLSDLVFIQGQPLPDAVAPPTAAYKIRIDDADGNKRFLSAELALGAGAVDLFPGVGPGGNYPRMDEDMVFRLVDPVDDISTINIGNSKEVSFDLRFERRE